jgi:ABC-2 type transport system ATP-binding protein
MNSVLQATSLGKRYGSEWALQALNLDVPEGRILALVGPNGAGKTTFLRLAVGLLEPTEGSVVVCGLAPRRDAASFLPLIGYVAQHPVLFRRFSVGDLLEMGSRLNPRWDNSVTTARLRQLDIAPKTQVGALSGGMRAQVALVLALAKRPRLLLLDEPVASLDPLARHEFLQLLMDAVATDGLTVILSSHIIGDLETTCDYLVVLTLGHTQLAGAMDDIVTGHRRIVGPAQLLDSISATQDVVHLVQGDRQADVLIRLRGPIFDPQWEQYPVDLQQIVIAYLNRGANGRESAPVRVAR